jgi:hypothetical protein
MIDLILVVLASLSIFLIHQLAIGHFKKTEQSSTEAAKVYLQEVGIHEYLLNRTGPAKSTKQAYQALLFSAGVCLLLLLYRLISSVS